MSSTQPDWELSKENIQPLKSGRKASKLENISKPKDLKALNEERMQYESELRMYDGPDPLDPWYRYITWIEQEYPKGGKEGNLSTLIESCIKKFKDEKSVRNDERFLEIWLKYAAMSSKPLEVFDFMYQEGLCTHLTELFTTWAWYLECSQAYKKAETIFSKGVDAMVERETKERLRTRQKQFRERVRRRLNGEEIPDEEVEEEQRSALGQLRSHGRKGKVSSLRVGAEKMGGPGVLSAAAPLKQPLKSSNGSGNNFKIFTDETATSGAGGGSRGSGGSSRVPSRSDQKENQMSAGTWTKAKVMKKSQNVPLDSISQYSQPAFTVYEEPNIAQPSHNPQRSLMPAESGVLATNRGDKKPELHCPVALFEPPDPTKAVMYCKDKVYQGTTEFSFEELRALRFMEKLKQQEELKEMDRRKAELLDMELKLKERQEAMERQMAEWQRMMSQERPTVPSAVTVTGPSPPSNEAAENSLGRLSRNPSLDSTAALLAANPAGSVATPSPSRPGLSQPSPTINTREAMDVMQKLWSKPIGEEENQSAPFVYCDPSPVVTAQPFAIFCDENAAPRRQVPLNRRSRIETMNDNDKENFLMPTPGENRENQPPLGYTQPPPEVRSKTGILTEANNVEFMPLEEQEKLLDQEENEEIPIYVDCVQEPTKKSTRPTPFSGNQTILLPNEEDFGEMAKLSSTPFNGKPSHHYEQDENTCAVDILYKMAPPPAPAEEGLGGPRLDTIVETSREYYKSSSSSSGGETLQHNTNRSHWGNTGHTIHAGHSQTAHSIATPGQHLGAPGYVTNSSGYLGDHSRTNNITKSGLKDNKRELVASPQVTSYDKKMKMFDTSEKAMEQDDEVFEEEPTGLFSDMMAELKQGQAQFQTDLETTATHQSFLQLTREQSRLELPQSPRLELSGLGHLNLTEAPRLDLTEAPRLDLTEAEPRADLTLGINGTGVLAVSPPPALELTGNLDLLADQTTHLSLHDEDQDETDPFHPDTHRLWLSRLARPVRSLHGYVNSSTSKMPAIKSRTTVQLGSDVFMVRECKGEGGYAKVFAAARQDSEDLDSTIAGIDAVLKVQKPANDWEFYICTEVQQRIPKHLSTAFMAIPRNYVFQDGGVFVSYHQKLGTLLDIINIVKKCQGNKFSVEPMAVFFTIELLGMIEALHTAGIIHGDLKADNLLLQSIPILDSSASSSEEMFSGNSPTIQLIDFGRSIDLTLLPDNVSFNKVVKCDGITSTEMKEDKPWREHIDYHGLAAISYCLLFQSYMETVKIDDRWEVKGSFKRWWNQDIWREYFSEFINIPGVEKENLPNLSMWKKRFQNLFYEKNMNKHLLNLRNDVVKELMA